MLKQWSKQNALNNRKQLSHVLMDGGVLSIPYERIEEFNDTYINAVIQGEKVFVVEQKTPVYNFFMDLDYKDDEQLDMHQIEVICKTICDKVNTLGGQRCIVCVANPKMVDDKIKTGMHLNWPGLRVDQAGALSIRAHVVSLLRKAYMAVQWEKVIDESVYRGSGFRLPWSHKMSKGKVEDPYLPIAIYEAGEGAGPFKARGNWVSVGQEPSLEHLQMATVRLPPDSEAMDIQPGPDLKRKMEGGFTSAQTKNEVNDMELTALLETFVRKNMQGQQNTRLTKLFKSKTGFLVSTHSQYCENVRRDHGSNHVWFLVDSKGIICQKCFCRCDTTKGRYNGFCKDFTGRKLQLPPTLVRKMFPDNKTFDNIKKAILPNAVINSGKPVSANLAAIYTNSFHSPRH
jgi:hypothetical protein